VIVLEICSAIRARVKRLQPDLPSWVSAVWRRKYGSSDFNSGRLFSFASSLIFFKARPSWFLHELPSTGIMPAALSCQTQMALATRSVANALAM
jgi:hypothetical protein